MGDLNIPAIPAPAPQPIIILTRLGASLNRVARLLPKAAPVFAIGPSDPAEPPNPRVTVLAMRKENVRDARSLYIFFESSFSN